MILNRVHSMETHLMKLLLGYMTTGTRIELYPILGWVRRVVGNIWNVGAGDPGSLPVRNANSGKPLKVD